MVQKRTNSNDSYTSANPAEKMLMYKSLNNIRIYWSDKGNKSTKDELFRYVL